ncbi:DUF3761 domain-containing protein [Anaeromyxobacter paludicola]|uniref:DUF3761 domain-containing protein n=1 Tax=Anaeromyxobacter paludicola TaxID=2918171 RepID=A0ABM7XG14_9BACT|nr:DUF3761 domain-containing protein [Anaeromyxobacter paludicola]BDG10835.1 hypothetical protein AMPC_39480 [Anaeromyxobacter paludicola]
MTLHLRSLVALAAIAAAAALYPRSALAADAERSVVCKDGTTAQGGRGACSGHGGVDKAATKAQEKAAKAQDKAAKAQEKAERKAKQADEKAGRAEEKAREKGDEARARGESKAAEATVICKDGATSRGGRGACRGHGGVDRAATARAQTGAVPSPAQTPAAVTPPPVVPPPAPAERTTRAPPAPTTGAAPAAPTTGGTGAAPDPAKGPPTARCKDGSFSYAKHHTGACSRHGGVAEWLDKQ